MNKVLVLFLVSVFSLTNQASNDDEVLKKLALQLKKKSEAIYVKSVKDYTHYKMAMDQMGVGNERLQPADSIVMKQEVFRTNLANWRGEIAQEGKVILKGEKSIGKQLVKSMQELFVALRYANDHDSDYRNDGDYMVNKQRFPQLDAPDFLEIHFKGVSTFGALAKLASFELEINEAVASQFASYLKVLEFDGMVVNKVEPIVILEDTLGADNWIKGTVGLYGFNSYVFLEVYVGELDRGIVKNMNESIHYPVGADFQLPFKNGKYLKMKRSIGKGKLSIPKAKNATKVEGVIVFRNSKGTTLYPFFKKLD